MGGYLLLRKRFAISFSLLLISLIMQSNEILFGLFLLSVVSIYAISEQEKEAFHTKHHIEVRSPPSSAAASETLIYFPATRLDAKISRSKASIHPVVGGSSKAVGGPYCPAGVCMPSETCCAMDDGSPGCCSYQNATCCGLNNVCCPSGTLCDPPTNSCVAKGNSTYCNACQKYLVAIESKGCGLACSALPPPADYVCNILDSLGMCSELVGWLTNGASPFQVCSLVGMCTSGTCSCMYCTQFTEGRCLSFPNHCPPAVSTEDIEQSKLLTTGKPSAPSDVGICWDGACSNQTLGCCLTRL